MSNIEEFKKLYNFEFEEIKAKDYNDCPLPAEQVAVAKYWYEKYGVVPAVITYDEIEFYVEKSVQTLEEAKKLAVEHYVFCYDIVEQCYGTFERLVDVLYKNIQWYFWWD